ncbi:MAG: GIY-YIG nuclease family protein [Phycisphaerales bacterium]
MTKEEILDEIKRTAAGNGGVALGWEAFRSRTGIAHSEWLGKHWARWSEAIAEAGFAPNRLQAASDPFELLEKVAGLSHSLGRLPTEPDIRLAVKKGMKLPATTTLIRTFGSRAQFVAKLREHCDGRPEFAPVVSLCDGYIGRARSDVATPAPDGLQPGFVYLMRSAKFHKVGRSNVTGRRHRELAIQLPERLIFVHEIRTDDTLGIEAYWHNRFADKRRNGEWFELAAADVRAFKKRKFM